MAYVEENNAERDNIWFIDSDYNNHRLVTKNCFTRWMRNFRIQ